MNWEGTVEEFTKLEIEEKQEGTSPARVVDHWNNLPQEIIDADSVNSFKSRLDKFWQKTTDTGQ